MLIRPTQSGTMCHCPKWVLAVGLLGSGVLAFGLGRGALLPTVEAAPQAAQPTGVSGQGSNSQPPTADRSREPVAYIYGSIPITWGELAEDLIARQGAERLRLLVNKRIIEQACAQRGIRVEDAEIDAAIAADIAGFNLVNKDDFENKILKRYKKNLYEWKEDVVRPKLLLTKLCRNQVRVDQKDLAEALDAHYGEKLKCRIIMWHSAEKTRVMSEIYPRIRNNEKAFDEEARRQPSLSLRADGGRLKEPIGRHTTGDEKLEKEAFALQPGEVSPVVESKDWIVVVKCDERIPPEKVEMDDRLRASLEKEIIEKKTQCEIARVFKLLRREAQPKLFLGKSTDESEIEREIEQELAPAPDQPGVAPR